MVSPAIGIKDLLVQASVGIEGASQGWGIFVGEEPDKPDTTITTYNTGGGDPNPAYRLDFPSVQVRVRGAPHDVANTEVKARQVKDTLLGIPSLDLNGDRWDSITMAGDIINIGKDGDGRPLRTLNFRLIIEPGSSLYRESL